MFHNNIIHLLVLCCLTSFSTAQTQERKLVGGPCEGCEALHEYGGRTLTDVDSLPKFLESSPKLKITGRVLQTDGKTPAPDVILYIYHTNRAGIYEKRGDESGWGQKHGYIRGWAKTDGQGRYTFFTFRPASYPNRDEPEHIHITVKEPDINEYYIDDIMFDDDPLLTTEKRKSRKNRGGSGITVPKKSEGLFQIERDIILGLNIPDYPE